MKINISNLIYTVGPKFTHSLKSKSPAICALIISIAAIVFLGYRLFQNHKTSLKTKPININKPGTEANQPNGKPQKKI